MAYIDDDQTQKANRTFIRHAMNEKLLGREEEQELARKWRDHQDQRALHTLINAYTRLVVAAATKFRHYGLPVSDLIQEGNIGLLQAANRFEPDRDIRFSTYAAWWIKAAMQDYVLRNWSIVRTGTTAAQKSLFFNLRRLRAKIRDVQTEKGLTSEGREKISKLLGVTVKEVEDMEGRMNGGDQSLNITFSDDSEDEVQNFLADHRPNPEEIVIGMKDAQSRSKWLAQALGTLTDREQRIIRERHLNYESVTLEDLGKELGVSKERVRQIEARAMEKLKDSLVHTMKTPQDFFALSA